MGKAIKKENMKWDPAVKKLLFDNTDSEYFTSSTAGKKDFNKAVKDAKLPWLKDDTKLGNVELNWNSTQVTCDITEPNIKEFLKDGDFDKFKAEFKIPDTAAAADNEFWVQGTKAGDIKDFAGLKDAAKPGKDKSEHVFVKLVNLRTAVITASNTAMGKGINEKEPKEVLEFLKSEQKGDDESPWYKSTWFIVLMVIALILVVGLIGYFVMM